MYALAIIDMQSSFSAANDERCRHEVIEAIKQAKKDKAYIINVRYVYHGDAREDIKKAIGKYRKAAHVWKDRDSGATQVDAALALTKNVDTVRVCGVNLSACVAATAALLAKNSDRKVEVLANACYQKDMCIPGDPQETFDEFEKCGIKVLNRDKALL